MFLNIRTTDLTYDEVCWLNKITSPEYTIPVAKECRVSDPDPFFWFRSGSIFWLDPDPFFSRIQILLGWIRILFLVGSGSFFRSEPNLFLFLGCTVFLQFWNSGFFFGSIRILFLAGSESVKWSDPGPFLVDSETVSRSNRDCCFGGIRIRFLVGSGSVSWSDEQCFCNSWSVLSVGPVFNDFNGLNPNYFSHGSISPPPHPTRVEGKGTA